MDAALKHRLIATGLDLISASGADRWLAPLTRGVGAILMFHHVRPARSDPFQPNALLEITPDFLDRTIKIVRELGYEIVPLDAVPDRLARGKGPRFVALTFDDGYRDNRDYALPILRRHGAPWTMFVTTDYASGTGRLWWLELEEVVRRRDSITLDFGGALRTIPARTAEEKRVAFETIYRELRAGPEERLRRVLAGWCDKIALDRDAMVRSLCLGWDELRELAPETDLTIGAHTLSHPMLAKCVGDTARREIVDGRDEVRARLGRDIRHLAYPVGDPGSAGPREFKIAAAAGFATAVTTRPGHLYAGHLAHLTALPRVSVNGLHQSDAAFRALMSGLPLLAFNRFRRVNVGSGRAVSAPAAPPSNG